MTLFTDERGCEQSSEIGHGQRRWRRQTTDGGKTQRGIQSVEVGGRVLLALAQARTPLALSDLAERRADRAGAGARVSGELEPAGSHQARRTLRPL